VQIETVNDSIRLYRISGEFDALSVQESRPAVDESLGQDFAMHAIDGSDLTLIDSSGIGLLVYIYKRVAAAGGKFALIGISGQPRYMLQLLKLDRSLPLYQNIDEALGALAAA